MQAGQTALSANNYSNAIKEANLALDAKPDDLEAKDLRLYAQVDLAVAKASEEPYQSAMQAGQTALTATNYSDAIKEANLALDAKPGDPAAIKLRTDAYLADVPADQLVAYKDVCARITYLDKVYRDYVYTQGYTENNKLVQENRAMLAQISKERDALETKYPALVADIPADQIAAYKDVCDRLNYLIKEHREFLKQGYTEANKLVETNYALLIQVSKEKNTLEAKYPGLTDLGADAGIQ